MILRLVASLGFSLFRSPLLVRVRGNAEGLRVALFLPDRVFWKTLAGHRGQNLARPEISLKGIIKKSYIPITN